VVKILLGGWMSIGDFSVFLKVISYHFQGVLSPGCWPLPIQYRGSYCLRRHFHASDCVRRFLRNL